MSDLTLIDQEHDATPPGNAHEDFQVVPAQETTEPSSPVDSLAEQSMPEQPLALPVNPARVAAGRQGGKRFHELVQLGREYEREHGLTVGRQRLKQLVQLGRRYEQERGLAYRKPRLRRGDAWQEFLAALARVVKPAYRAKVEQLMTNLVPPPGTP